MSNASDFDDSWTLGERSLPYVPGAVAAGIDVAELQGLLNGLGYQLPDDGIYGLATARQLRQFQEHRGLGVDGVFGPVTFRELSRVHDLVTGPVEPHYVRD